jgi:hypothetical protein
MPTASEVVLQYALYYAFAFNLDIARPCFERAPDFTVITGRNAILRGELTRAPRGCPDQGKYNDRGDVDPFDRQGSFPECRRSVTAKPCLRLGFAVTQSSNAAIQWLDHTTMNKGYSPASPLQALGRLRPRMFESGHSLSALLPLLRRRKLGAVRCKPKLGRVGPSLRDRVDDISSNAIDAFHGK